MNKQRRNDILNLAYKVAGLAGTLTEYMEDAESIKEEEEEYFDNMPEGLQGSEKGDMAQEAIGALEEVRSALEEMINTLDDVAGNFETASQ